MTLSLMRPVEVAESDETSVVEYDAKILLSGNKPLTITLADAAYNGCRVVVMNACEPLEGESSDIVQATITTTRKLNEKEQGAVSLQANGVLSLTFFKDTWYADSIETSQGKKIQKELSAVEMVLPTQEPDNKKPGSIWITFE